MSAPRSSFLWGWVVGALVAVVMMMVQPWGLRAAEVVSMAIYQPSRLATKSIVVFDPAPDIYESRVSLILSEVERGQRSRSPLCLSLRQQDNGTRIEGFDFLKILFVSVAGPANIDCIADISSGQVATVDECDMGKDAPTVCFVEAARFRTHEGPLKDSGLLRLVSDAGGGNNAQTDCCNHQHQGQSIQCQRVIGEPFVGRHIFIFGASLIVAWAIIIGWAVRA